MATSISDLPDEVLINIFSYLNLADRKNTRLVCKLWHILNYASSLIKNDITAVNNYKLLDQAISPNVKHFNVRTKLVHQKNFPPKAVRKIQFWSTCGQTVKSIEIFQIDVFNEVLADIFENCPNLEYISLSAWDENDTYAPFQKVSNNHPVPYQSVNLPKLLSLDLMHMSMLTSEAFVRLTENALNLKRLSLEWWRPQNPSKPLLTALENFITRQSGILKELNLSHSHIKDDFLISIVNLLGPSMTGLYLHWCECLNDQSLCAIAKKLTGLKELDISRNINFTESGLLCVLSALTNLTHICLKKIPLLNDTAFKALKEMHNLTGVDISHCCSVTGESIMYVFGSEPNLKMMDLRLSKIKINDDVIVTIAPKLPNLRFFYLNGCSKLSDRSLEAIFAHNKLLRCLSLQDCKKLCNLCVGDTVNALKGLIHLDLFGCNKISGRSLQSLNLLELQTIDLSDISVSVQNLSEILSGCPSLQYFYLDYEMSNVEEHMRKKKSNFPIFRCGYSRFEADSLFD